MFLILLHMWYGGAQIIHQDVHILFICEKVPHVLVEETSLFRLKCWSLWATNEKLIPILNVVGP